jgi:hypothetical protein
MNTYHIRFNKTRGQAGRGTIDHVWRVFENDKEFLLKNNPMINGHTKESKQKISLSLIGHKQTEFQKKRVSECNRPQNDFESSNRCAKISPSTYARCSERGS